MQSEEVAQLGDRWDDANHSLANEGEDRQKSNGVRTQMHHVDLIMVEHGVEEIGKGGN